MLFQNPSTQLSGTTATVFEEVAFGPCNLGLPIAEVVDRVWWAMRAVGVEELAPRDPSRLSGGQSQLVALAGVLALRPRYLILDEPTSELDPAGTALVAEAIVRAARETGAGVLLVEHKTEVLARVADEIVVLERGAIAMSGPAASVLADPPSCGARGGGAGANAPGARAARRGDRMDGRSRRGAGVSDLDRSTDSVRPFAGAAGRAEPDAGSPTPESSTDRSVEPSTERSARASAERPAEPPAERSASASPGASSSSASPTAAAPLESSPSSDHRPADRGPAGPDFAAAPAISLEDVTFEYPGGTRALDGLNLRIEPGESVAIVGQNGSGKSTLARHLNGLLRPGSGRVLFDGRDVGRVHVAELARIVGLAFQNPDRQLFAGKASAEVEFGPRNLGIRGAELDLRVAEALAAVGLAAESATNPYDFGYSRRKLLAIASVLAMRTPVLVLDEPTTGQDARGVACVRGIVAAAGAAGRTVIAISHDMGFVAECFGRVVVMRAGRVVLDGPPSEVFAEAHWPELRATYLEPPLAAVAGARLGLGSTPTRRLRSWRRCWAGRPARR